MKQKRNQWKQKINIFIAMSALVFTLKSNALTDSELNWIALNGGDINKVAIQKHPGPQSIYIQEIVHSKEISLQSDGISFKWTELGYGALTHKVIIPELAKHTLLNHRNDGEDGPCLRSDFVQIGDQVMSAENVLLEEGSPNDNKANLPKDIHVKIQVKNNYIVDKAQGVCKVQLIEDIRTVINNEEFYHVLVQDIGFRFIEDCPN